MRPQLQMVRVCERQPAPHDVLIFSSDSVVAMILRDFLTKQGFSTSVATDFSVVLKIAAMEWPVVVLLDCAVDCVAVAAFIEELRRINSLCKIIVMSESVVKKPDGQWVLRKPFTPEDLLNTINEAIATDCSDARDSHSTSGAGVTATFQI